MTLEMWFLGTMHRITWRTEITNEAFLEGMDETRKLNK